jgi:hypothetical protein
MTADNKMNPIFHVNQITLHKHRELEINHSLSSQEQELIAISTPIMSFFKIKGPQQGQNFGFEGNVIKISHKFAYYCLLYPLTVISSKIKV